jgi:acyl dehydratase
MPGLWFEDFVPGAVTRHGLRRTVTETDNVLFSTLTHNGSPLHLDAEFMRDSEFGRPLVNSCFTFGLMIGISVADTTQGTAIANLGYDAVRFPKPVFAGDTLRVETEVRAARPSGSRPEAGVVTLAHRMLNQRDELVASCERAVLVRRRPAGG